jgi:DNA polymerase II large subunit
MMDIKEYFERIETEVKKAYEIATEARKRGADPEDYVDIPLAKNLFERVEGLVGAVAPQIVGKGIPKRLEELDKKYGSGDWRVALKIAEEVAKEKFCKFESREKAIEVGIRVGLAYITMGVVSAPLEGFVEFKIKKRNDGGEYGACYFAGPIRAAGGTAAAVTLLIADYLRRVFNLQPFDITKEEIERTKVEVEAYHTSVARLQYYPEPEELDFLLKHLPIELNGDPTSEREVLIYKDLPRVGTPKIRGGMCLVLCEGLAQKAPKLLKRIEKWGDDFNLSDWKFLKEYVDIKTRIHAGNKTETKEKIAPNDIYIRETVAGRPVF